MFTEAEPEEQTESTTCSFPTLLFAACPHIPVNRQLIETSPHTLLFPPHPHFISSFICKPLAVKHNSPEGATQQILEIGRFCLCVQTE